MLTIEYSMNIILPRIVLLCFVISTIQCAIVIPPITFTGTKTATEKQIIGEQTELEEDVWMISSAKTTSEVDVGSDDESTSNRRAVEEENRHTYLAFSILDIYSEYIAELKKDRVVGENQKGLLSNLMSVKFIEISDEIREKYNKEYRNDKIRGKSYNMLIKTIEQVNIARGHLVEGYIVNQKRVNPKFKPNKKEMYARLKDRYHKAALKGEYIQNDKGVWEKK